MNILKLNDNENLFEAIFNADFVESYSEHRRGSNFFTRRVFEITEDRIELEEVELISDISGDKYDDYVKNKQLYRNPSQRVDFNDLGKDLYGNLIQNLNGRAAGFTTKYIDGKWIGYFLRSTGIGGNGPLS